MRQKEEKKNESMSRGNINLISINIRGWKVNVDASNIDY